jgi:hypothetical protein
LPHFSLPLTSLHHEKIVNLKMIYGTNAKLPTQGTGPNDHSDATKEAWEQYQRGKELGDQRQGGKELGDQQEWGKELGDQQQRGKELGDQQHLGKELGEQGQIEHEISMQPLAPGEEL